MNRTYVSTNRSDGSSSVLKSILMYHINIWEQGQKGMEIYEIWLAPDHKMPYCNNKGTLFIIAINSDPCYINNNININNNEIDDDDNNNNNNLNTNSHFFLSAT
jgi:hypothetical protein